MSKVTQTSSRKSDHIQINLDENVDSSLTSGLENYRFTHQAIPEINMDGIDTRVSLFDRELAAPLLISSMTGGTEEASTINRILATAAQETGIAMGLGSQRAAIENSGLAKTYQVREFAPDALLFANLGAVQLNYGYGIEECQRAVDMIQADALILHFNALQEAVQPEGDTDFSGLVIKIEDICKKLSVPVIAKEVGWGISKSSATLLSSAGIAVIDVGGAGGTSWSQVEMYRANNSQQAKLAGAFAGWGIPTAKSILQVKEGAPKISIFASGGLRSGIDIAKCIALGATIGGMASPFLKSASDSLESTIQTINGTIKEIQVCMFAAGAKDLDALQKTPLEKS